MWEVEEEGGGFRGAQTPQPMEQRDLCKGGHITVCTSL